MKRLILLILTFVVVGSVFAIKTDYSQWDTSKTTQYWVLCNEDDDMLKDLLDNADWMGYAPKVVNIKGHKIFFASEKDLYRAISHVNENEEKTFAHFKAICDDGKLQAITAIYVEGANEDGPPDGQDAKITFQIKKNNTKVVFVTYQKGIYFWGASWNKLNGNPIGYNIIKTFYLDAGTYEYACKGDNWPGSYATVATTLLIFDKDVSYKIIKKGNSVKTLYEIVPMSILEVYTEQGANIYLDGSLIGTSDNGGYFKKEVENGEHQLKISKDGFWDYTTTINIQNDTELHIDLVPKNAIFGVTYKLEDNAYPDSIATMNVKLSPIRTAYGTRMRISGVDVIKVVYNGQELEKSDDGSYILGDISKEVELEIQFKTPSSWGEHSFTIGLEASDVEGNLYSQQETITYEVLELPFLLELPEWKIGDNTVRVTDTTGQSYAVLLVLHDKDGNEVWSESKTLLEYGSAEFNVKIPSAGDYVLEIQGNGAKTYKEIHIVEPITLITKEVKA